MPATAASDFMAEVRPEDKLRFRSFQIAYWKTTFTLYALGKDDRVYVLRKAGWVDAEEDAQKMPRLRAKDEEDIF